MSGQNPREIAARVLGRRAGGEFVEDLLSRALAENPLAGPDRGLCQELVYGVVRWQRTLDWLVGRKTAGRTQKAALLDLLRLGLYQVFWLARIPNHAAVNETVELAKRFGFGPQAGFINALLRTYLREFDATRRLLDELKTTEPAVGYSHPDWLVKRWQDRWGPAETARLLAWNNTPPKTCARVNTLKGEAGSLLVQWRDEDVEYDFVRGDWFEENLVFELKSHPPLETLASFQQGRFYIQDPSTLLAVKELDPRPGETILDLCAAPGGKLTYIAQLMGNEGRLVAHDSVERLKLVEENCARLGVTCAELVSGLPARTASGAALVAKGPAPESGVGPPQSFDKVLVDAPCSNTGVMRRRVDLRWRIRPEELERLRKLQLELLDKAADLVKPGGRLVYSTCSLEPEENRGVVDDFLKNRQGFELARETELLPFVNAADGAYVARIVRAG